MSVGVPGPISVRCPEQQIKAWIAVGIFNIEVENLPVLELAPLGVATLVQRLELGLGELAGLLEKSVDEMTTNQLPKGLGTAPVVLFPGIQFTGMGFGSFK